VNRSILLDSWRNIAITLIEEVSGPAQGQ